MPGREDASVPTEASHAQVAQLVEHTTENRGVGGSIPPLGTIQVSEREALAPTEAYTPWSGPGSR
jgi:hypothetical protein